MGFLFRGIFLRGAGIPPNVLNARPAGNPRRRRLGGLPRVAVPLEAIPEPGFVDPVRLLVHLGHVAEDFDSVSGGIVKIERAVLPQRAVPLRMAGAVDERPADDLDAAGAEMIRPGFERLFAVHLEGDVMEADPGVSHPIGARVQAGVFRIRDERNVVVERSAAHEANPPGGVRVISRLVSVRHPEAQDVPVKGHGGVEIVHLFRPTCCTRRSGGGDADMGDLLARGEGEENRRDDSGSTPRRFSGAPPGAPRGRRFPVLFLKRGIFPAVRPGAQEGDRRAKGHDTGRGIKPWGGKAAFAAGKRQSAPVRFPRASCPLPRGCGPGPRAPPGGEAPRGNPAAARGGRGGRRNGRGSRGLRFRLTAGVRGA